MSPKGGCFTVVIQILNNGKNWKVKSWFEINLHVKDINILYEIKSFFSVGNIYNRPNSKNAVYRVSKIEDLNKVIIPHFLKYPLITSKSIDFLLWSEVVKLMLNKKHLGSPGFLKILEYYASVLSYVMKKEELEVLMLRF